MQGGNFALYKDEKFNDDRICHKPKLLKEFPVMHNTGVLLLNSNEGFHSNTEMTSIEGWRKWVYCAISSKRTIWTSNRQTVYSKISRNLMKIRKNQLRRNDNK